MCLLKTTKPKKWSGNHLTPFPKMNPSSILKFNLLEEVEMQYFKEKKKCKHSLPIGIIHSHYNLIVILIDI